MPLNIGQRFTIKRSSSNNEVEHEKFFCYYALNLFFTFQQNSSNAEKNAAFTCPECMAQMNSANDLQAHFTTMHENDSNAQSSKELSTMRIELNELRNALNAEKAYSNELTKQIHNFQSKISYEKSLLDCVPLHSGGVEEVAYYLQQIQMLEAGKALATSQILELEKNLSDRERMLESAKRENSLLLEKSVNISKQNADLSAKIDEESTIKQALDENIRFLQEKIVELTSELNARPSEDDVAVLRKALIDAQTLMNEITCEKESEIDKLRIKLMALDEKLKSSEISIEELQRELEKRPKIDDFQRMKNNTEEMKKLETVVTELRANNEKKQAENVKLKENLKDLEEKLVEQTALMTTLNEKVSVLQSMLIDAKDSLSDSEKKRMETDLNLDDLRRAKCDLTTKCKSLEDKMDAKEIELNSMKTVLSNKENILRAKEIELSQLLRENEDLKTNAETLADEKNRISPEKNEIVTKRKSDESMSSILNQMIREKEALEVKVKIMDEEYSKKRNDLLREIDEFKLKIAEQNDVIGKLTSDNNELISKYEEITQKLQESESRCNNTCAMLDQKELEYRSYMDGVVESKKSVEEQVRILNEENSKLKTELQEISKEKSGLKTHFDKERISLMEEIKSLKDDQQKNVASLSALQIKLNESQNFSAQQIVDSGSAIKSLQQTVDELKTECLRLQEQLNITMETNKQECGELNILVTGLEQTVTDLKRQRDDLEERETEFKVELEKSAQKLQHFENVQSELNDKIAVLTFDLTSKENLAAGMAGQISKLETEMKVLLCEEDELKKKAGELSRECGTWKHNYEKINDELTLERESSKDSERKFSKEINSLKSEISESHATTDKLRARLQECEVELHRISTDNKKLREEIDKKHVCFANLDAEKIQLESIVHDLTENSDEKDQIIKQTGEKVVELRRRCEILDEKSSRSELELLEMQNRLKMQQEKSQTVCCSLQEELNKANNKLETLEQEKIVLVSKYDSEIANLNSELATARCSTNESHSKLSKNEIKLDNLKKELRQESLMRKDLEAQLSAWSDEKRMLIEKCVNLEKYVDEEKDNQQELKRRLDDAISAMHDLGREHQSLQIDINKHFGRKWADDKDVMECLGCSKPFSVTVRKHHCRNCGMIFCNDCSNKTFLVASSKKPVRVCDTCHLELNAH